MATPITFSGLGSGIDIASIVDALVSNERQRYIVPYTSWKTEWTNKISSTQALNTKLVSLHTTINSMDTLSEFMARTAAVASSSVNDVLTASASSTALNGSYSVEVGSNISHRLASDGKADRDSTAYASSGDQIQITVGSNTETITLDGGTYTLEGIASEIAADSSYVTAEVIDDGSSSNQYRLVLTADTGGTSNRISIGTNNSNVDFNMSGTGDRVDDVEGIDVAKVTTGGNYVGTTNKTFFFTVSGTSTQVGADDFDITWTDSEGNSGTISVTSTDYTNLEVFQGVELSLSETNTVYNGETFSVNVWHPELQAPQDEGLAKAENEIHSGFLDTDTTDVTSSDGTFSYTYNGQSRSVNVSAGTTLSELADLINEDAQNPGITAGIINDGSGLSTSYHLVLTGNSTGSAYKIESIEHDFDNLDGSGAGTGGGFSEEQSAQNAMITIDGYPTGTEYLQRQSNTISDLISGVTLFLEGTGTATVTVSTDTSAVKQSISDFIDAFNDVRKYIKEQTSYDADKNVAGLLLGNYGVDIIKNRLNEIVSGTQPGFRDAYDTYINLMQIGIHTDVLEGSETQGEILINDSVLDSALSSNPDAVAELFSEYFSGRSAHGSLVYSSHITGITEYGTFEISFNNTDPSLSQIRIEGGEWHTAIWDSTENTLTGPSGTPESGLVVEVTDTTESFTGEVDIKLGLAGVLKEELDFLINPTSGPLAVLEENYQDIIDNIDDKIEFEEKRVALYEQRLTERYARLEALLSELNAQSSWLSMEVAKLNT